MELKDKIACWIGIATQECWCPIVTSITTTMMMMLNGIGYYFHLILFPSFQHFTPSGINHHDVIMEVFQVTA